MSRGAQPFPFRLVIFAPIWVRGLIIRPMGRLWIELSPVSTVSKDCPERMPDISLVVVPLFPVSRMPEGADSPCSPLPCIFIRSGDVYKRQDRRQFYDRGSEYILSGNPMKGGMSR